jgi:hypothetical protein
VHKSFLRRKYLYSKYRSKSLVPEEGVDFEDPFPSSKTAGKPQLTLVNERDLEMLGLDMLLREIFFFLA